MKELKAIRNQLGEKAEKEAHRLYRLARNAEQHGCSDQLVSELRGEGILIYINAKSYPERLLMWDIENKFKYAFR